MGRDLFTIGGAKMQDIVFYSGFGHDGYAQHGRKIVYSLMRLEDYRVKVIPARRLKHTDPLYELQFLEVENPIKIFNSIPKRKLLSGGYCSTTEINKPPTDQLSGLMSADFVLAVGDFPTERFKKALPNPDKVHCVNFPFMLGEYSPYGDKIEFKNIDDDVFKFLVVARIDIRKNLPFLIDAFKKEFGDNDKVALILKVYSSETCIPLWLNKQNPTDNIYWCDKHFTDMSSLYRSVDAYCVADLGEGWGAPCTEAMLSGLPTIAPRHSGHLSYMNDDNSWLVEVGDWELIGARPNNKYESLLPAYRKVKYPKMDSLRTQMREVYEIFKDTSKFEHPKTQNATKIINKVKPKVVSQQLEFALKWITSH